MTVTTKISFSIIVLLVFSLAAVFALNIFKERNDRLQTALIEKQKEEQEYQEYKKGMKDKKEIAAIKRGEMKMLTGVIEDIKDDMLVIDIDPLGKHKRYQIKVIDKTGYHLMKNEKVYEHHELDDEGDPVYNIETNFTPSSFDSLEIGKMIEVHFKQRIDVDSAKELIARKIVIFNF